MKKYHYYVIPAYRIPKLEYSLSDNLFIFPINTDETGNTINNAIVLCSEQTMSFEILDDFIVFHSFITDSSDVYIAHEKNKVKYKEKMFETKEMFIKSMNRWSKTFVDKYTGDFDRYPPFYDDTSKKPEMGISYRKAFENFIEAKNNGNNIYNCIRLYVFLKNLKFISKSYKNDNLTLALLYTILDAYLRIPEKCNNNLICDSCGREMENHDKESIAKYQNRKLKEIMNSYNCDPNLINDYQKLLTKINKLRNAIYHGASYYSFGDEFIKENKKNGWPKKEVSEEEWDFKDILNNIKSLDGRKLAFYTFSDFMRTLLINKLIDEKKFYPKFQKYTVCKGTAVYRK